MATHSGWVKVVDALASLGRTALRVVTAVGAAVWLSVRWCVFQTQAFFLRLCIRRKMRLLGEAMFEKLVAGQTVTLEDAKEHMVDLVGLKDRIAQLQVKMHTDHAIAGEE